MRKTVCVDLDGVLAQYDKWLGIEHIGEPIEGAVAFTKRLGEFANVLIFTTRCREKQGDGTTLGYTKNDDPRPASELKKIVADWLDKHGFHYDDIWTGPGKPIGSAYIDDRSVVCTPQTPRLFCGHSFGEYDLAVQDAWRLCGEVK